MFRTILVFLAIPTVLSIPPDDLHWRVANFQTPHNRFVRDLYGCPPDVDKIDERCHPARGIVNYSDYSKARKAAAKLYYLKPE